MRVLAIQTYPGANLAAARHFPFYENAGADRIIGITTEDGGCDWPGREDIEVGPDCYVSGDHLCRRLLETISACLESGADELMVAEYDTLFFRPMPPLFPDGLVMNATGGGGPEFRGLAYYHGPWCMNAVTAQKVVASGRLMLADGDIEHGWPDRFIGRLAERFEIPAVQGFFKNYSRNCLDTPEYIAEARAAIAAGAHAVHGVKTVGQLEALLK